MYMYMCNCAYLMSTCKCTCIYNNDNNVGIVIYSRSH